MGSRLASTCSLLLIALAAGSGTGCGSGNGDKMPDDARRPSGDGQAGSGDGSATPRTFRTCLDGAMPADLPTVDWSSSLNELITQGTPWHSAQDMLARPGVATALPAKFSYGSISKDLEQERIEVWIDDCAGGYTRLGERVTDSDGRIALDVSAAELPDVGAYGLYFRVMGDNSAARSVLRVYPPGTRFIVFDIDATLTTSDSALVGQVVSDILGGDYTPPVPRQDAAAITALRTGQHGYELIYLTGRPYLLDEISRAWLRDLGFPGGTVHLTDEVGDSWPSDAAVGDYKADFLRTVTDQGFILHAAYGNASSDIYAYEQAGIAKERTYILGTRGGESQTIALGEGYTEHIEAVRDEPPAAQPFLR